MTRANHPTSWCLGFLNTFICNSTCSIMILRGKETRNAGACPAHAHQLREYLQWQCRSALCIKNIKSDQPQPCLRRRIFLEWAMLVLVFDLASEGCQALSCQKCFPYKSSQLNNVNIYKSGLDRYSCPQSAGILKSLWFVLDHRRNSRNCSQTAFVQSQKHISCSALLICSQKAFVICICTGEATWSLALSMATFYHDCTTQQRFIHFTKARAAGYLVLGTNVPRSW